MSRRLPNRVRLHLEALEDRCTPSGFWGVPHAPDTAGGDHQTPALVAPSAGRPGHELPDGEGHEEGNPHTVPFLLTGGGAAPDGLPVFPGGTGPHNATGWATGLGKYTGQGTFELLSLDPATLTGTFRGSFVFVAANGDRLAMNYGADPNNPGTLTLIPQGNGQVVAVFVAVFTPDPQNSTGRFAHVTGGSFVMVATSSPFSLTPNAQGFTPPFTYTWVGEGSLQFGGGGK